MLKLVLKSCILRGLIGALCRDVAITGEVAPTLVNRRLTVKNTLVLSLLLIASAAKGVAAEPDLCWENSLKPKGIPGTEITLARDGKALYTILIPTGPSTEQQKAADDLAQWLGCMTGTGSLSR